LNVRKAQEYTTEQDKVLIFTKAVVYFLWEERDAGEQEGEDGRETK
jgi:hypothetical protein